MRKRLGAFEELAVRTVNLKALRVAWLSLLFGLPISIGTARAQPAATEYEVKAAFLYNFVKFVEWPSNAFTAEDAPITIGVLGENPFGANLETTIKGKTVNGRPLAVKLVTSVKDAGLKRCHVIFICQSERKRLNEIMAAVKGTRILTVSELDPFLGAGGMIKFTMEANKVRFEINDEAVKESGLCVSSKLLNLAKRKDRDP